MAQLLAIGEAFPSVELADAEGLLAVGGTLSPFRLLNAYRRGIFPWPLLGGDAPVLWFSPNPRFVLFIEDFHCPRSLAKLIRKGAFRTSVNQRFGEVIRACAAAPRAGQEGTWITAELIHAYEHLHRLGIAHSVEVYSPSEEGGSEVLVGGLYGLAVGRVFFGESMFSSASNSSKVGFASLVGALKTAGFALVDCQQTTRHLGQFGAEPIERERFCRLLERLCKEQPSTEFSKLM